MKVYLDNCCYNRPFDEQDQNLIIIETEAKLIIQNRIKQGVHALVWSFMLDSENDENPSEDKKAVISPWKNVALEYCSATDGILKNAKEYMNLGFKHKDAIHLACAVKHNCNYLISTDKKYVNKNNLIQEIEIVNPITFLLETEETR
ncbi:MAG: hypothetical protein LBC71_03925 [Oscillospiraceae bacterium]|nr:hypothetical protein [Oscillospiraceae bacterium]